MAYFSERYGYIAPRTAMQFEEMTDDYRTDLWNSVYMHFHTTTDMLAPPSGEAIDISTDVMRMRYDHIAHDQKTFIQQLSAWWWRAQWFLIYDALDAILANLEGDASDKFTDYINADMEKNLAACRVVAHQIVKVDSDTDVEAIEDALEDSKEFTGPHYHLENALRLMADRDAPDYANSIKESISAVEAVSKIIVGKPSATMGAALDRLAANGVRLHKSLIVGWKALYGYMSDTDGIRHSGYEPPTVDQSEAKYWLVTCSAFVSLMLKLHRDSENEENR